MRNLLIVLSSLVILAGCTESGSHKHYLYDEDGNYQGDSAQNDPTLGKSCDRNADCAHKLCVNNVCRFESSATVLDKTGSNNSGSDNGGSGNGGSGNGGSGNSGSGNSGSGNGGSGNSGSGNSGSASSGGSSMWVDGGSTPSGSNCVLNRDCESGLCDNGVCSDDCEQIGCSESNTVCRYGKCIPVTTDGGECSLDNYTSKCKLGQFCCNGFCRDTQCEPQIICERDSNCLSDYCTEMIGWGVRICGCNSNIQCGSSMYCDYDYDVATYGSVCLVKQKINTKCGYDSHCESAACINRTCQKPLDLDEECDSDGDCKSGTCGDPFNYETMSKSRWEGCHKDDYSGSDCFCSSKYANGESCYQDSNCESGYCNPRSKECGEPVRN